MRELTKKVLEAGLVNKHAALMFEKWGNLESGASELVGKNDIRQSEEVLTKFVEDIEELIDKDMGEVRETRLDIQVKPPVVLHTPNGGSTPAAEDEMGRYIVKPGLQLTPGEYIMLDTTGNKAYYVLSVEPLYRGETVVALQITVE